MSDRVLIINRGKIVASDTTDNLSRGLSGESRLALRVAGPEDEVIRHFQPEWEKAMASHALALTGVRRCGKSTLQGQVQRGIKGPSVTINLEDTRLYGMGPEDFPTLLSVLDARHPKAGVYLDEVQEAPEWQRLVRALLDAGRRVCLTGSNASLLGREMGSKLTGRHLSHEVYPFSFQEYLEFTGQKAGAAAYQRLPGAMKAPGVNDHGNFARQFLGVRFLSPEIAPYNPVGVAAKIDLLASPAIEFLPMREGLACERIDLA